MSHYCWSSHLQPFCWPLYYRWESLRQSGWRFFFFFSFFCPAARLVSRTASWPDDWGVIGLVLCPPPPLQRSSKTWVGKNWHFRRKNRWKLAPGMDELSSTEQKQWQRQASQRQMWMKHLSLTGLGYSVWMTQGRFLFLFLFSFFCFFCFRVEMWFTARCTKVSISVGDSQLGKRSRWFLSLLLQRRPDRQQRPHQRWWSEDFKSTKGRKANAARRAERLFFSSFLKCHLWLCAPFFILSSGSDWPHFTFSQCVRSEWKC